MVENAEGKNADVYLYRYSIMYAHIFRWNSKQHNVNMRRHIQIVVMVERHGQESSRHKRNERDGAMEQNEKNESKKPS